MIELLKIVAYMSMVFLTISQWKYMDAEQKVLAVVGLILLAVELWSS